MDDELARRLLPDNPFTYSYEGLDDGCFWCGADPRTDELGGVRYGEHAADCAWMAGRAALGLDVGRNVFHVPWCDCGHERWEHRADGCTGDDCTCTVAVDHPPVDLSGPFGFPFIAARRGSIRYVTPPDFGIEAEHAMLVAPTGPRRVVDPDGNETVITADGGVCAVPVWDPEQIMRDWAEARERELLDRLRSDD